jgi:uncharacterized protein (DUF305 family)
MDELEDLDGTAFEQRWLELMTEHHEGAVEMAQAEQEDGSNEDAVALAEDVEASQTAEIDRMREMLAGY